MVTYGVTARRAPAGTEIGKNHHAHGDDRGTDRQGDEQLDE